MRLAPSEVSAVIAALSPFLSLDFAGSLLLFGSRTNDAAYGGDIDLALVVQKSEDSHKLKLVDYKIVAAIKRQKVIGDRRIDFKVLNREEAEIGFFHEALKNSIILNEWSAIKA